MLRPCVFFSWCMFYLYLYSTSILYYWHLLLTRHLPEITKILILSSYTLSTVYLCFILTILGQTFPQAYSLTPVDSPWLLRYYYVYVSPSYDLIRFISFPVDMFPTAHLLVHSQNHDASPYFTITQSSVLVYILSCKGHCLFRLGLLCKTRTLNPLWALLVSASLSTSLISYSLLH